MAETFKPLETALRSSIDKTYRGVVHPYITRGGASEDREIAHERALEMAEWMQDHEFVMRVANKVFVYDDPILATKFAGVDVPNPLGIAAGFDKNARIHRFLGEGQGFGLVTVGSITKIPYGGNERPRIFDLPESDGVINRMGFPGNGADEAEKELREDNAESREYTLIVNLAASKPSFEKGTAIEDYVAVAEQLLPYGEIHEINVSSPNTPGVRGLQEPEVFAELAAGIEGAYRGEDGKPIKPYVFKFGPDLSTQVLQLDVRTAIDHGAAGVTVTNTSTDPEIRDSLNRGDIYRGEMGGISGTPLREKALKISNLVYEFTGGELPIKRAGGIKIAEDVWYALSFGGAEVVDVYTAFIRCDSSTPNFTHHVLSDLAKAMRSEDMQGMQDFERIRGRQIPFPKIK